MIKTAEQERTMIGRKDHYKMKDIDIYQKSLNIVIINKTRDSSTTSDKIDQIVTNRRLALPIFAIVIYIVYLHPVTTIGTLATDWTNDWFVWLMVFICLVMGTGDMKQQMKRIP